MFGKGPVREMMMRDLSLRQDQQLSRARRPRRHQNQKVLVQRIRVCRPVDDLLLSIMILLTGTTCTEDVRSEEDHDQEIVAFLKALAQEIAAFLKALVLETAAFLKARGHETVLGLMECLH